MKYITFFAALFALVASAYSTPTNSTGSVVAGSIYNATHNATATSTFALKRRQSQYSFPHWCRSDPWQEVVTGTVANPITLPIPSGKSVALSGGTNAAFIQRVIVTNQDNTQLAVFQGIGEASDMFLLDGNGNPTTNMCFTLPQQIGGKSLILSFLFAQNAQSAFELAVLKPPRGTNTVSLESEDSTDNDNNDTEFTVSFQTGNMPGCWMRVNIAGPGRMFKWRSKVLVLSKVLFLFCNYCETALL